MARYVRVVIWVLLCAAASAHADDMVLLKERNARLEATVEELTLKLAESLKAQRELEAALTAVNTGTVAPAATLKTDNLGSSQPSVELTEESLNNTTPAAVSESVAAASSLDSPECKVSAVISGYRGTGEQNKAARAWLGSNDHLRRCSSDQLQAVRKTIRWDFWGYSREAIALIDRELEKR